MSHLELPIRRRAIAELMVWAENAQWADITYHRQRKILWDNLKYTCRSQNLKYSREFVPPTLLNSIRSALCCRNEQLSDEKRLAFDTAVAEILDSTSKVLTAEKEEGLPEIQDHPAELREELLKSKGERKAEESDPET